MFSRSPVILLFLLLCFFAFPSSAGTLKTLKVDHPRILAHAEDFDRIAELVKTDPLAKRWYGALKQKAESLLDEPAAVYELRDGRRLLYVSREVLARVKTLSMLHRIEPDQRYLDRIWADMEAVAGHPATLLTSGASRSHRAIDSSCWSLMCDPWQWPAI